MLKYCLFKKQLFYISTIGLRTLCAINKFIPFQITSSPRKAVGFVACNGAATIHSSSRCDEGGAERF